MVRKLMKYDFTSYIRLLLPVQLILLGIAALNRFVQLFESNNSTYNILFTSSTILFIISIAVVVVLTLVVSIVRFYQGMYSNEGYLSHTLPVTPSQHICSKLLTSLLFYLGSFLAIFLSLNIVTIGELNIEIYKAFGFQLGKLGESLHGHLALYIIELILLFLSYIVGTTLCIFFCISVGQLAQKRKILLAFGAYFGIYVIGQIIGTIIIIFVTTLGTELVSNIAKWAGEHMIAFMHIVFCSGILLQVIVSLIYFLLTRYIMNKKLNLT